MFENIIITAGFFFIISSIYGSVGLGGGTAYLAVMALSSFSYEYIPSTALFLNIAVASTVFYRFYREGYFVPELLIPFVSFSIPAAFAGGMIPIPGELFSKILALVLLAAGVRMVFFTGKFRKLRDISWKSAWLIGFPVGVTLGLISGVVGMGGGVLLGPFLILSGLAGSRNTAASTSAFILLNSISGFIAHSLRGSVNFNILIPLTISVFSGGYIGSILGSRKLSPLFLQRVFGILILFVAVKLGFKYFV